MRVLILLENSCLDDSLGLVELAQQLTRDDEELEVYGLGINCKQPITGLDYLIQCNDDGTNLYDSQQIAAVALSAQKYYHFDCILALATSIGCMVAPRVAMELGTGLVADVTGVELTNNEKLLIRPAFQGDRLASILCQTSPMMMTVHPGVFNRFSLDKKPEIKKLEYRTIEKSRVEIIETSKKPENTDIRKAKVLVSGGNGIAEHFDDLNELANQLGGLVSASRKLVDKHIAPRDIQVGQSGKTVSPELYIAVGISGASQHLAGLKNIDSIISINTDPKVPMCFISDLVVEADGDDFVKKLIQRIKKDRK